MKGVCSVLPDKQVTKKEKKELLLQVEKQLDELMKSGEDINFQILSRKLGIARSTLYRNTSVRQMVISAREDRKIPSDILTRIQENNRELEDRVFKLEKKVMELERSSDSK